MDENQNLLDSAPYLSPWYLSTDKPKLYKDEKLLKWRRIGNEGLIELTDEENKCYGIFNMSSYIHTSKDNKSFLVWYRGLEKVIGLQSISIFYYQTDELQAIADKENEILKMKKAKQNLLFSVAPKSKVQFQINPSLEAMKVNFPDNFKKFDEFIFITELQNLYDNIDSNNFWNTTMLCIKAYTGWVFNYPQD